MLPSACSFHCVTVASPACIMVSSQSVSMSLVMSCSSVVPASPLASPLALLLPEAVSLSLFPSVVLSCWLLSSVASCSCVVVLLSSVPSGSLMSSPSVQLSCSLAGVGWFVLSRVRLMPMVMLCPALISCVFPVPSIVTTPLSCCNSVAPQMLWMAAFSSNVSSQLWMVCSVLL